MSFKKGILFAALPLAFSLFFLFSKQKKDQDKPEISINTHTAQTESCELNRKIRFAGLNWDSNTLLSEIVRVILEKAYNCKTDIIPGSILPLLTGLQKGDVDIMVEIWEDNIREAWNKAKSGGDIQELGQSFKGARQGFYIPRYLVEGDTERGIKALAPDLKSVSDLAKYKHLFKDKEFPSKGRMYNCVYGWGCEIINSNKLKAYKLEEHFTNFRPGTGAALDSAITSAYKKGKPFLAYYWEPTWIMGRFDLVLLEEPPFSSKDWDTLTTANHPNPVATAYPLINVKMAVNKDFAKQAPKIVALLKKFELNRELISKELSYMETTGSSHREAAIHFLQEHPDLWKSWLEESKVSLVLAAIH